MYLILDPKDEWVDRSDDRKEKKLGKITVTVPRDYEFPRPAFCPCCLRPMRDVTDPSSYEANSCCFSCDIKFARPNIAKWKEGWRPSREEVDLFLSENGLINISKNVLDQ